MLSARFLRFFGIAALVGVGLVTVPGCGASSASGDDPQDEPDNMTADELRARSEDMFKPTTSPVQVIPATLKNLVQWELYVSAKGTTVIGRSRTKKAKAIFVQLIDPHRSSPDHLVMKGSGYLVASDFRLDSRSSTREMRLLAAAIRKDFAAVINEPPPANPDPVPTAPEPTPAPTTSPDPTPAPTTDTTDTPPDTTPTPAATTDQALPEVSAPPPAPDPTPAPPAKPCVRSVIKTLVWGIDILKDTASVVTNGVTCPVSKNACGSAVAAFAHGMTLVGNFDELTCKSK